MSDVFPELRQSRRSGTEGPRNGTAPTLLTNYLDVSLSLRGDLSPLGSHPWCVCSWGARVCCAPPRCSPCRGSSRPNISARSASGPPHRPSRWFLTQAQPTCGCRPTNAPPSTVPVVSTGARLDAALTPSSPSFSDHGRVPPSRGLLTAGLGRFTLAQGGPSAAFSDAPSPSPQFPTAATTLSSHGRT